MRTFFIVVLSLVVGVALAVVLFIAVPEYLNSAPKWAVPSKKASPIRVDQLSIFATAVISTLGAVATIALASLGLSISRRQEARDHVEFAEERMGAAVRKIATLIVAVDEVYAGALWLDARIPTLSREEVLQQLELPVPEDLAEASEALAARLTELATALSEIAVDEFSTLVWRRSAASRPSLLRDIRIVLTRLGVEESSVTIEIESLIEIKHLVTAAASKLRDPQMRTFVQSRLVTNSAGIELFDNGYDNAAVQSLMFAGNLILHRAELEDGTKYLANFGAAILHDLVACAPGSDLLQSVYEERYGRLGASSARARVDFDPANLVSTSLGKALVDADEIGDLYLLLEPAVRESLSSKVAHTV